MANEYAVNQADLKTVADAIRAKAGLSAGLAFPDGFAEAIEAISSGGGAASGLVCDMGEFSVEADVNSTVFCGASSSNPVPDGIPHNFGDVPDFICVWTDHWAGITEAPYSSGTTMVGFVWLRGMSGMTGRASAAANYENPIAVAFTFAANDYRLGGGIPSSATYGINEERLPNAQFFKTIGMGTGSWWRAGATYKYFVSKAWWNVGGGANV